MRKRISLKTRRPDLSREEFRAHYEGVHVPLGLAFIEHFHWRRYRRNHVLSCRGAAIGFDCYAEFWVDRDEDDSALSEFVASPDFQVLNDDDERFLDVRQRVSFDVQETPLVGSADDRPGGATLGVALRDGAKPSDSGQAVAARLVDSLGSQVVTATLDVRLGGAPTGPPPAAPFDSLLRLSLEGETPETIDTARFGGDRCAVLVLDPIETSPELLYAGPGA